MEQYASNLNWFDITLISIVFISTIFAMFRGLIKAVFSLITWVSSGYIALYLYPQSHDFFADKIQNDKLVIAASSLGMFLALFIIIAIINSCLVHMLRKCTGGFIDRTLGMCFGAARGLLIIGLIFFSISLTSKMLHIGKNPEKPGPEWFSQAGTYQLLDMMSKYMVSYAPEDMPQRLEQTVTKFQDITLSVMGDELKASSGSTKIFTEQERQLMKQITASLSQEDLSDVYKKYDGIPSSLSEFERIEIFNDIITKYKNYIIDNKIALDEIIVEDKIQALEKTLNDAKTGIGASSASEASNDETGYKDNNIKQMNRLIDGVK